MELGGSREEAEPVETAVIDEPPMKREKGSKGLPKGIIEQRPGKFQALLL